MSLQIQTLQTKLGLTPDGSFGPATLKAAATHYKLTPEQASHFFGQCSVESGGFTIFNENLNYSAQALIASWPTLFNCQNVGGYAMNPQKIADRAYANRMGNGDETSGDGWRYKGRGAVQLTGKANYQAFANSIGKPEIMTNPDLLTNEYAFESALFYFTHNNLWALCTQVGPYSITKVTRAINGGLNGFDQRYKATNQYYQWFK